MSHSSGTPVHLIRIVIAIASTTVIVSFMAYIILGIFSSKKPEVSAPTNVRDFTTGEPIKITEFKVCQEEGSSSDAPVDIKLYRQKYNRNGNKLLKEELVAKSDTTSGAKGTPKQENNLSQQKTTPQPIKFYNYEFPAKCSYFDYQQYRFPAGFYKLKVIELGVANHPQTNKFTNIFKVNAPPKLELSEKETHFYPCPTHPPYSTHVYHRDDKITIKGTVSDENGWDDISEVQFSVDDKEDGKQKPSQFTGKNNDEITFDYTFNFNFTDKTCYKISAQAKDKSSTSSQDWNVAVIPKLQKPTTYTPRKNNFGDDVETKIIVNDNNKSNISSVTCNLNDLTTDKNVLNNKKADFDPLNSTNTQSIYKCKWGKLNSVTYGKLNSVMYLVTATVIDILNDHMSSDPSQFEVGSSDTTPSPTPSNTVDSNPPGQTH